MEENFKNKFGLIMFIFVIVLLLVGGYILTDLVLHDKDEVEENITSYKIDEGEEYIYFNNESVISEDAEIYYKDVVINLSTQTTLTESLNKENEIYKNTITYISDQELLSDDLITYNYDDLYALIFRTYDVYEYGKYVSLLITDYNYSCFDSVTFYQTKSYVFNTSTGELLEESELLSLYNTNMDKVLEQIEEYLESIQNEDGVIKISETINSLDEYAFYINNLGRLEISFLVKTEEVDYNEIMEVE